ncbi:S-adenosyl-L-methionine-dependent methyltransferase [Ophiobolus disseminans]|uniref:S-adenosyl-L-methionine-dependent methyltransferase n=1 Tax=Ophiobolus disseminans TaxID=1469910 RepID=A0A6A7AIT9_9PLEO|nr:S-adenosyl-L-methionine-dependent methyltransferase [Ophiobolus disseminans]
MPAAILPNSAAAEKLEALAAKLTEAASDLRAGTNASPQSHAKLVDTLRSTVEVVNRPTDDLNDMMMGFVQCTAIRLLLKWNVFENLPTEGTISYKELAAKVGGDESLITRLCWFLVATGMLKQEGADQVAHTARSRPYASVNPLSAMLMIGFDEYLPSFVHMPRYFDTYGAHEPSGRLHSIKASAEGQPELTATEIMYAQPERVSNMALAMSSMENMYPLAGVYDYSWIATAAAAKDADTDRALVVDVGGAKGHTLEAICKDTPGLPLERCVLQDLPEVIEVVKGMARESKAGPKMVGMDFFNEQPIKGALVYIIRRCLHDFSDKECIRILTHLSNAMAPDSRLLIGETVLSNPPSRPTAMVDLLLSTIGGKERTIDGFNKIAERAGLKVSGVHRASFGDFSIIEYKKA